MKSTDTTKISNKPAWAGYRSIFGDDWGYAQQAVWRIGRQHIHTKFEIPTKYRELLERIGAIEYYHRTWNPQCIYVRLTLSGRRLFELLYGADHLLARHSTGSMEDYRCPA